MENNSVPQLPPGYQVAENAGNPIDQPVDDTSTPSLPEGFQLQEDKYGSLGQQAISGLEGVAKGVLGPLATGAEVALGVKPQDIRGRAETNPWTSGIGEAVGFGGSMISGLGEGALVSKLGQSVTKASGLGLEGSSLVSKVASHAVGSAAEVAALQASDELSNVIKEQPGMSLGQSAINVGLSGILGGAGGAIIGAVSPLFNHALDKIGILERPVISELDANAVNNGVFKESIENSSNIPENIKPKILGGLGEQKENAKEIIKSAQDIGSPVLEGMTSASKWIQEGEDALVNGAPTISGIARQKKYQEVYNAIENTTNTALGEGSDYTQAELGNVFKGSLTGKIEESVKPISDLYNEIKQGTEAIPLSERSAPAIARNIEKLQEFRVSPGSPEGQLASRVIKEIENLKTVDDVKTYKSILMRSISPTASSGEKRMSGILADKLSQLEERSIERYAKDSMKTPQAKERVLSLIDKRDEANALYKPFIKDVGTLAEKLGKGRVYGAQDAINFINDLTPESVVQKLFSKKDSEFLKFFSDKFPEEMDLMRQYQKGVIRDAASKSGELTPNRVFSEIDKLQPEIKKSIFTQEELNKLKSAQVVSQSIPESFNPSGTSHVSAFRSFFEHPTGAIVGNIRDKAIEQFIKHAGGGPELRTAQAIAKMSIPGKINESKASIDYIRNVISGESLLNKSISSLFKAGAEVIPQRLIPDQSSRDRLEKSIEHNSDIKNASNVASGISHYLPNHASSAIYMAANAANYLNSLKPTQNKNSPFDRQSPIDKGALANYKRQLDIAQQPLMVLQHVKNGTLKTQDVRTLNTIYPDLHKRMVQKAFDEIAKVSTDGKNIPYSQRQSLSLLMGKPLDSTMTLPVMQAVMVANSKGEAQMAQKQRAVSKSTSTTMAKVNSLYETPNQSRAADRSGH